MIAPSSDCKAAPAASGWGTAIVRYDRRGHGKSDVPKGPYAVDDFGRDALAIMDGLGLQKVNWCGLSMGGYAAFACLRLDASRVHGIVLVSRLHKPTMRALAYAKAGRVKTETARLLGIKTSALYYKLEKYGIS